MDTDIKNQNIFDIKRPQIAIYEDTLARQLTELESEIKDIGEANSGMTSALQ